MLLNDHVLKPAFPGFITGKLSDFAGLVFFPLLVAELAGLVMRRDARQLIAPSSIVTAAAFALVKLTPAGAMSFAWGLGAVQSVVGLALTSQLHIRPVAVATDATDLMALPAVVVAVAIGRVPAGVASRGALPALGRRRYAPFVMGAVMAVATMATAPPPAPPTGVVVSEPIKLEAGEVAVRHVAWSVKQLRTGGSGHLRLEVSTRTGAHPDPTSSPFPLPGLVGPDPGTLEPIRIVPDDPRLASAITRDGFEFEFTTLRLDLASSCSSGCTGGARIVLTASTDLLVVRLTTGLPADNSALSMEGDGVGDYTGPVALADSGAQEAQVELDRFRVSWHGSFTLHVAAAALAEPAANLRILLRTNVRGVDDKAGLDAKATLSIADETKPIDLGGSARWHLFDLADLCTSGVACEIPIELDVVGAQSTLPGATPGQGVDVYRWSVRVEVLGLDGRSLPSDAAWITPTSQ